VEDSFRFMVPETMVHNIIRIYHDDMAHCDAQKTRGNSLTLLVSTYA